MIEIRDERDQYRLFIDGTAIDKAQVIYDEAASRHKIRVLDAEVGNLLLPLTPADFPPLCSLRLQYEFSWSEKLDALVLYITVASDPKQIGGHVLQFGFQRGFSDWKTLYGFDDYMHGLKEFSRMSGNTEPRFYKDARSDGQTEGFIAEFSFSSPDKSIATELNRCVHRLVELHSSVRGRESLAPRRDRTIEMSFNFPAGVRVICEQYLLYFIEFLRDLGVEAMSELTADSAGRVLFTIKPMEKQQALDQIRMALDAYLHLPAVDMEGTSSPNSAPEVQRLAATVQHFKSQLTLAHATLQMKNATIEAMATVIEHQRKLVTGEVLYASIEEPNQSDRNENVFEGLIKITPYEGKGFIVNLPEFYRRLKKLFTK